MEAELNVIRVGDRTPLPGPNDYVPDRTFGKVPAIKIHERNSIPERKLDPALVNVRTKIGDVTKISIHERCPEPKTWRPPGPSYVPPALGQDAPKIGFPKARKSSRRVRSPGPSDYYRAREFGLESPRTAIREGPRDKLWDTGYSPGPAAYKSRWDATHASSPRYSIKNRYEKKTGPTPSYMMGPKSTLTGPKFSMPRSGRPEIFHI